MDTITYYLSFFLVEINRYVAGLGMPVSQNVINLFAGWLRLIPLMLVMYGTEGFYIDRVGIAAVFLSIAVMNGGN